MSGTHEPDCLGWYGDGRRDEFDPCRSWCFGCMRCEPNREGDYRTCGECGHAFRSAEELLHRHLFSLGVEGVTVVSSCPVCAHDF